MENILNKIQKPNDVRKLNKEEKEQLATEIRELILKTVSKNGGHLASNLGVVELTIALHSVFNTPKDKIIWDVGHQCYVHKILTGRKNQMNTLRKLNGIAGFPKVSESEYDVFNTGHSSTSISVATGIARGRDILNEDYRVIAVIGDGSLTGGIALEALNDAGSSKTKITVILNDNEMSISKNVGGIPIFLSKLRTRKSYTKTNIKLKKITKKIPLVGKSIVKLIQRSKKAIKQIVIPNMYFEDIGFTYLGPVDGHNIEKLESILERSKEITAPVLIHVVTKKGKGYKFAEENPDKFHGISAFDLETGEKLAQSKRGYSDVFGDKILELGKKDKRIVCVTAAMKDGTGLKKFAKEFPDRFFDVGIAEQHAVALIAGMARAGLKPVFPVYSSFLQRSYDQIVHDIAIQKLPVVICIDRAGVVGNDGETHQGIFDISFLSSIPNVTIMAPKDFKELEDMLEFAINFDMPVFIRYPRGGEGKIRFNNQENKIELGKAELLREGEDITIIATGKKVANAMEVANILENRDKKADVINVRFIKPLDEDKILESVNKTKKIITIEDNLISGGLASSINDLIARKNITDVYIQNFGYNDVFVEHGDVNELEEKYKVDSKSIVEAIYNNI